MTSFRRTLALAASGSLVAAGLLLSPAGATGAHTTHAAHAAYAPQNYTVKNGHKVTITLETAADGGYGWAITRGAKSANFTVVSKKLVSTNKPGLVGGPSKTIYVLRMTKPGKATFAVVERRSFDKTDVINRFTLHLTIKP